MIAFLSLFVLVDFGKRETATYGDSLSRFVA